MAGLFPVKLEIVSICLIEPHNRLSPQKELPPFGLVLAFVRRHWTGIGAQDNQATDGQHGGQNVSPIPNCPSGIVHSLVVCDVLQRN